MWEIALILISGFGLGLALHTTRLTFAARASCATGCSVVMASPYSSLFGFPNAVLGVIYCSGMVAAGMDRMIRGPELPLWPLFIASAMTLILSAYLAYRLFLTLRRT